MRIPTEKKFWFTIKKEKIHPNGTRDGNYFYKMKDLKGTIIFGYIVAIKLFGKNIL